MNDDIDHRFETIGELDYIPRPLDATRRRRTMKDCQRENEYHELRGIEVFCRPVCQDMEEARRAPRAARSSP